MKSVRFNGVDVINQKAKSHGYFEPIFLLVHFIRTLSSVVLLYLLFPLTIFSKQSKGYSNFSTNTGIILHKSNV